jgi:hypothetical protein
MIALSHCSSYWLIFQKISTSKNKTKNYCLKKRNTFLLPVPRCLAARAIKVIGRERYQGVQSCTIKLFGRESAIKVIGRTHYQGVWPCAIKVIAAHAIKVIGRILSS